MIDFRYFAGCAHCAACAACTVCCQSASLIDMNLYKWSDGTLMCFKYWNIIPKEPSGDGMVIEMHARGVIPEGGWNDIPGTSKFKRNFICQTPGDILE